MADSHCYQTADQCLTLTDQGGQQSATTISGPRIREAKKDPLVDLSSSTTLPRTGTFLISSFIPAPPAPTNSTTTIAQNGTTAITARNFEPAMVNEVGGKRHRDADSTTNDNEEERSSSLTDGTLVEGTTVPVWAVVLVITVGCMAMIGLLVWLRNLRNLGWFKFGRP